MSDRSRVRGRKKKIIGICTALAVFAGVYGGISRPSTTLAYGIFSGVESVVSQKVSASESYRILEIVPDGTSGEMGYLAAGYEPEYLQDELAQYMEANRETFVNTAENRSEYMQQLVEELESRGILGDDLPLANTEYEESYFPTAEELAGMNWMYFPDGMNEMVTMTGSYQLNDDGNGLYGANILSFRYSEDGDYYVEFESTQPIADEFPYNQPYEYKSAGYYEPVENVIEGMRYFYITEYAYQGSNSAASQYTAILDAEKPYSYVRENGDFDFIPAELDEENPEIQEYEVEIGQVAYRGGIANNNWFADKILNESNLKVEVLTVTESELAEADISGIDFIYICGDTGDGTHSFGAAEDGGRPDCAGKVQELVELVNGKLPMLIDSAVWDVATANADGSDIYALVQMADGSDAVKGNIYCINTADADGNREAFFVGLTDYFADNNAEGYAEVRELIRQENLLRVDAEALDTKLSKASVIQYIINFSSRRELSKKESLVVLDIEPAMGNLYLAEREKDIPERSEVLTKQKVAEMTQVPLNNIQIVRMTTAEFIGKTEDLNTAYDMVYFGLGYTSGDIVKVNDEERNLGDFLNRDANGRTVYNDSHMNGLIYTHVGDAVLRPVFLGGLLDTDYVLNNSNNYLYGYIPNNYGAVNNWNDEILWWREDVGWTWQDYNFDNYDRSKEVYGYRNQYSESLKKMIVNPVTIQGFIYNNPNGTTKNTDVTVGNVGVYRYAGNDISKTKYNDLMEFVGARYPVVFADGFVKADGSLNDEVVDNASILYEFMVNNRETDNVFFLKNGRIESEDEASFASYVNMPKLLLTFYNPASATNEIPVETALATGEDLNEHKEDNYGNKVVQISTANASLGVYDMRMKFRVGSSVDSSASTRYLARLYLDMNADGKFVVNDTYSELMDDILILNSSGNEVARNAAGEYMLTSGSDYILQKEIPSEYRGILTWKLEICQSSNPYVRTSKIAYTVVSKADDEEVAQTVNVLQVEGNELDVINGKTIHIRYDAGKDNQGFPGKWTLATDTEMLKFAADFAKNEGIEFKFHTMTAAEFEEKIDSFDKLRGYDMLIFGFRDSYSDIKNEKALNAIGDYINSGRSVLFTHDTTSFSNVETIDQFVFDIADEYPYYMATGYAPDGYNNGTERRGDDKNAFVAAKLTQRFRDILGMDRYGVTYNEHTARDQQLSQYRSSLLKQGQLLDLKQVTDAFGNVLDTIGTIDTSAEAGGVVTRKDPNDSGKELKSASLGTDKDIAYVAGSNRTQSYGQTQGHSTQSINFGYNPGAVLANQERYPFNQYMQLAATPPANAGEDALGILHDMKITQVNDGQITHYPYEIGEEIKVAVTHAQWYQLNLDEDVDDDGTSDIVVWYCLSANNEIYNNGYTKNMYTASPNDARNNYYIYSIGNVMYSGVGHSTVEDTNEKMLFFNTIVAAYKTSIKNPSVKILESSDRTALEKTTEYLPYDVLDGEEAVLDDEVSFYFTVSEPNLVTSQKKIYVDYMFEDGNNKTTLIPQHDPGNGKVYITTEAVNKEKLKDEANERVSGIRSGYVYKATIHNLGSSEVLSRISPGPMKIQVHATSEFDYYGESYGSKEGDKMSPEGASSLKFVRMTLFDLD